MFHSIRAGRTVQRSVPSESIVNAATNANATKNGGANLKKPISNFEMVLLHDSLSWPVYKIGSLMFAKLRRATISFVIHPTARPPAWNNSTPTGRIFINPLNAELNPICYLLALLGPHHFLHVSRIRVKSLTLRLLMSYIYIYIYMPLVA